MDNKVGHAGDVRMEPPAPGRANAVNSRFLRNGGIAVLVLAGITYIFAVLPGQQSDANVANWMQVEANVVGARVAQEEKSEPWGNSRREYIEYRPQVVYKYIVDGNEYSGGEIARPAPAFRNPHDAEAIAARFPAGSTQEIWVNPDNPDEAVLMRDTPAARTALFIGSLMLGILGGLGVLFSLIRP